MKRGIRRTKIVATLGPAWERPDQMRAMLDAGVDVVRINASHGTPEVRAGWIRRLVALRAERKRAFAILVDLHGPRIRVGKLEAAIALEAGARVVLAPEETAAAGEIPTTYRELARDVSVGSHVLLDDGLLDLEVSSVAGDRVHAVVRHGGQVKSQKGINLPGVDVSAPTVTDKDREEADRAAELGTDYIGVSFVRRPADIDGLRTLIPASVRLVAKIEKDTALDHLEGIVQTADALMVARGDLGVELPFEQVPLVQKRLIREANRHGKPIITATQMLESMTSAPRPTRAEASDVANAILDGTDAVMLSGETAVGSYPLEAVLAMDQIAREVETHHLDGDEPERAWQTAAHRLSHPDIHARTEDAIAVGVCAAAELLGAPVILCLTSSGFTARTVASYRPSVPILAATPEPETFRRLALVWGVIPVMVEPLVDYDAMLPQAREVILASGLARPGDRFVVTAGVPFNISGTTNLLRIETL